MAGEFLIEFWDYLLASRLLRVSKYGPQVTVQVSIVRVELVRRKSWNIFVQKKYESDEQVNVQYFGDSEQAKSTQIGVSFFSARCIVFALRCSSLLGSLEFWRISQHCQIGTSVREQECSRMMMSFFHDSCTVSRCRTATHNTKSVLGIVYFFCGAASRTVNMRMLWIG